MNTAAPLFMQCASVADMSQQLRPATQVDSTVLLCCQLHNSQLNLVVAGRPGVQAGHAHVPHLAGPIVQAGPEAKRVLPPMLGGLGRWPALAPSLNRLPLLCDIPGLCARLQPRAAGGRPAFRKPAHEPAPRSSTKLEERRGGRKQQHSSRAERVQREQVGTTSGLQRWSAG